MENLLSNVRQSIVSHPIQFNLFDLRNLFKGIDRIHLELFDQRSFTEDSFIGECNIQIPAEVLQDQVHQHWYPLMGRDANANENQGDILIIMSFTVTIHFEKND